MYGHMRNSTDCNIAGNCTEQASSGAARTPYWALVLLLIPSFTLFGNLLVIISVATRRGLHSPINFFILGLAVADLCVALAVMPFAVYVEFNEHWELGTLLCDLYCAADVTCSTASIFLLTVISFDRYVAATQPIRYANSAKGIGRVAIINAAVWLVSMLIASPMVLGLNNVPDRDLSKCMFYNADFIIYSSTGSFCIPLVIIIYLYGRIYCVIRRQGRFAKQRRTLLSQASRCSMAADAEKTLLLDSVRLSVVDVQQSPQQTENECVEKQDTSERGGTSDSHPSDHIDHQEKKNFPWYGDRADIAHLLSPRFRRTPVRSCSLKLGRPVQTVQNELEDMNEYEAVLRLRGNTIPASLRRSEPKQDSTKDEISGKSILPSRQPSAKARSTSLDSRAHEKISPIGINDDPKSQIALGRDRIRSKSVDRKLTVPIICGDLKLITESTKARNSVTFMAPTPDAVAISKKSVSNMMNGLKRKRMSDGFSPLLRTESRINAFFKTRSGFKKQRSADDAADMDKRWLRRLSTRLVLWRFQRDYAPDGDANTKASIIIDRDGARPALISQDKRLKTPRKSTSKSQRKEKKATKTLGIVLGIFLICWLPFFTLNLLNAVCIKLDYSSCQVGFLPFFLTTWLGYTNSLMNPIIYTIFNADFRRAFKEILCPCLSRRRGSKH